MSTAVELTPGQRKEARYLLDLASQSAGVVLGQVTRDYGAPGKLILTLAVIGPNKAKRIERIVKQ